jgi:hypothetical protein
MKQSVKDRLLGRTNAYAIKTSYVKTFYPEISQTETSHLLELAGKAWKKHMKVCVYCPTQCVSLRDEWTDLFDRLDEDMHLH